jgi:putative ABC transport system substrate-binding protein
MRRREFIAGLAGAAWPIAARAQTTNVAKRIAILLDIVENPPVQGYLVTFRKELQKRGWIEGQNLKIDLRFATSNPQKIRAAAADLVRDPPDIFLALSTLEVRALLDQTHNIPIVFTMVTDSVGAGFAESLSHPGGSVTGFENFAPSLGGKWVQLLRELSPAATRLAIVFDDPNAVYTRRFLGSVEGAASELSIQASRIELKDITLAAKALDEFGAAGTGAVVVLPSQAASTNSLMIIAAANRYRLPAVYPLRHFVVPQGGLISYGVDEGDQFRRAAEYVDRILRGEKPAVLPIQTPTRYELVANLRTAKAQGINIPATILASADEVIE